jgi:hypothetical protein
METYKNFRIMITKERLITYIIIVGLIIGLLTLDQCRRGEFRSQQSKLDSTTLALQTMVIEKNKLGDEVVRQNVIITDNQENIKNLALDNMNLKKSLANSIKKVKAYSKVQTNTSVVDIDIPYEEDIIPIQDSCDSNVIRVPKVAILDTTDLYFRGTVTKDKFKIDSLSLPNIQNIAFVETGGWFRKDINGKLKIYKKPKLEIIITNTNNYVKTTGLSSAFYQPPPKARWLERVLIAAGAVAATILLLK